MNLVDNISTYLKAQSNTHHVSELMLVKMLRENASSVSSSCKLLNNTRALSGAILNYCPFRAHVTLSNTHMTITPASVSAIAEMIGDTPEVTMMIGIGLQKESDAVYFQYMGDDQTQALMLPSGNPVTRLQNIRVVGLSVAEEVGTFKSTKLNVIIESTNGTQVMLTSGLTTLWSQFLICGLSALYNEYGLDQAITLNTWKGTSSMRPCFACYLSRQRTSG